MGRLRDGYEIPLFQSMSEEVVDLFGMDDVTLHRHNSADNTTPRDPVWDEPYNTTPKYKEYKIKAMHLDFTTNFETTDIGGVDLFENKIYVSLTHLLKAGVPQDETRDYIGEGDLFEIFKKGRNLFYDIIQVDRVGFINDTDEFTGYEVQVKRNLKYVPERKDYNT